MQVPHPGIGSPGTVPSRTVRRPTATAPGDSSATGTVLTRGVPGQPSPRPAGMTTVNVRPSAPTFVPWMIPVVAIR